jgi:hypothetical protein
MVEWVTLLPHIRVVPNSDLSLVTSYPDRGFSWFSSFHSGECQDSTLHYAITTPFQIIIHISSFGAV